MSKLQVDDIVNKDDNGSVGFSRGAVVTGVATATSFSGDITGNVTGNINSSSATGVSTVGVLTAYSSIHINVGSGSTEVATELKTKASTGKAIAMSMVFG
jgi:hypothetical protein